jgi:hypothetical protein
MKYAFYKWFLHNRKNDIRRFQKNGSIAIFLKIIFSCNRIDSGKLKIQLFIVKFEAFVEIN